MNSALTDDVGQLLAQAASQIVLPRFRALGAGDVMEKSPGEVVTVADRAVEALLIPALSALRPGSRVVGEEGVAENPSLLQGLDSGEVWVVDPIDGTANFVAGRSDFGIMVALLREGEIVMSWIQFPLTGALATAQRGAGAWLDGQRLQLSPRHAQRPAPQLQGMVKTGFMSEPLRSTIEQRASARVHPREPGTQSACGDYVSYALGAVDMALYWRTLPWDHAPGALLLTEAGGHVARFDGTPYRAADVAKGLLVARSVEVWEQAHAALVQG